MSDFTAPGYSMVSGRAEAEQRTYKRIDGKKGVWLIAIQPNEADHVYFHDPKAKNSDGFGGSTLQFLLEDGSTYSAKGPWKVNCDALYADTGCDIRDKYLTFVVIGKGRLYEGNRAIITDVVYQDTTALIGIYDRYETVAANLPAGDYFFFVETAGGTHSGAIHIEDGGCKCPPDKCARRYGTKACGLRNTANQPAEEAVSA